MELFIYCLCHNIWHKAWEFGLKSQTYTTVHNGFHIHFYIQFTSVKFYFWPTYKPANSGYIIVFKHAEIVRADRQQCEPRRSRTHRSLPKCAQLRRHQFMPLPTCSVSLPVLERPFSAWKFAHGRIKLRCSIERNLWRLSGIGKPVFWLDTVPLSKNKAASRVTTAQCPAWRPAQRPP